MILITKYCSKIFKKYVSKEDAQLPCYYGKSLWQGRCQLWQVAMAMLWTWLLKDILLDTIIRFAS